MALFLSGQLMSLLGAILPAWRYHIESDFLLIAAYFLCLNLGSILGTAWGRDFIRRRGLVNVLVLGCGFAATGLALLGVFSPPAHFAWRLAACFATGFGAGLIHTGALHAIVPAYEHEPASTLSLGGVLFNLGALTTVLVVAGAFFAYTIQAVLLVMAFVPAVACVLYARSRLAPGGKTEPSWREALRDFRSPAAILFSLLLFF
ncbi:MAG: hypothetical protein C0506_17355, partial [Anaerolinea sp.]|nr:hypothetical protein [Anaerolinea sp.]